MGEPLNNSFPNAGTLLLYTFGYNLGESWFFNQQFLYWQNLYLGDPLSMPFGDRPSVTFPVDNIITEGEALVIKAEHPFGIRSIELFVNGERISSIEGDELSYSHPFLTGETPEVLAVATAKSKNVERLGWPVESMKNRSRPKGWAKFTLKVSLPAEPIPESCGCNSNIKAPGTAIMNLAFLLFLFQRRRYPSTPTTLLPACHQINT